MTTIERTRDEAMEIWRRREAEVAALGTKGVEEEPWVDVTPAMIALWAIERAASEMYAAMTGDQSAWPFALTNADQALTAALVQAVSGTANVGALTPKVRARWDAWHENPRASSVPDPEQDQIAEFSELMKRAFGEHIPEDDRIDGQLWLSTADRECIALLHEFRGHLVHVKPRSWFIGAKQLPRLLGAAAEAIRQMFGRYGIRILWDDDEAERAENAIATILGLAGRT
jgi:hypothetical protein